MLEEAINKTLEKENMNTIILDWKGCGKSEQRQQMIDLIEKNNLKVIRTSEI
jgi:D-tyrosyl-tRNA(Tyr) deacylase